jgi:hypothetical protein
VRGYTQRMNHLKLARQFAESMDSQFNILGIKFGWDSLIGFVPGLGDAVSVGLSFYLLWVSYKMRVPADVRNKILSNIILDAAIGAVPLLGDVIDLFFKANMRNLALLEKYSQSLTANERRVLDGELKAV